VTKQRNAAEVGVAIAIHVSTTTVNCETQMQEISWQCTSFHPKYDLPYVSARNPSCLPFQCLQRRRAMLVAVGNVSNQDADSLQCLGSGRNQVAGSDRVVLQQVSSKGEWSRLNEPPLLVSDELSRGGKHVSNQRLFAGAVHERMALAAAVNGTLKI